MISALLLEVRDAVERDFAIFDLVAKETDVRSRLDRATVAAVLASTCIGD